MAKHDHTRLTPALTPAEGRRFGLQVGLAFLVIAAFMLWRDWPRMAVALAGLGSLLVAGGVLIPGRLGPVHAGWMGLALLLSRVTTPILLTIMYFGIIAPIGALVRVRGRNPIVREASVEGYWIERPEGSRTSNLKRQF